MHAGKEGQHAQLCSNFAAFGWQSVRLHTFVLGHTGVMYMFTHNATILAGLGVHTSRVGPFLIDLAIMSLQLSCAILSCFPRLCVATALPNPTSAHPSHPPPPPAHPSQSQLTQLPSLPPPYVPHLEATRDQTSHLPSSSAPRHAHACHSASSLASCIQYLGLQLHLI